MPTSRNNQSTEELLLQVVQTRREFQKAEKIFRDAQQQLINTMVKQDIAQVVISEPQTDTVHTATLVQPTLTTYDTEGLHEEIDESLWEKIVKHDVDRKMLNAHLEAGLIPYDVVERNADTKPGAFYLKITHTP